MLQTLILFGFAQDQPVCTYSASTLTDLEAADLCLSSCSQYSDLRSAWLSQASNLTVLREPAAKAAKTAELVDCNQYLEVIVQLENVSLSLLVDVANGNLTDLSGKYALYTSNEAEVMVQMQNFIQCMNGTRGWTPQMSAPAFLSPMQGITNLTRTEELMEQIRLLELEKVRVGVRLANGNSSSTVANAVATVARYVRGGTRFQPPAADASISDLVRYARRLFSNCGTFDRTVCAEIVGRIDQMIQLGEDYYQVTLLQVLLATQACLGVPEECARAQALLRIGAIIRPDTVYARLTALGVAVEGLNWLDAAGLADGLPPGAYPLTGLTLEQLLLQVELLGLDGIPNLYIVETPAYPRCQVSADAQSCQCTWSPSCSIADFPGNRTCVMNVCDPRQAGRSRTAAYGSDRTVGYGYGPESRDSGYGSSGSGYGSGGQRSGGWVQVNTDAECIRIFGSTYRWDAGQCLCVDSGVAAPAPPPRVGRDDWRDGRRRGGDYGSSDQCTGRSRDDRAPRRERSDDTCGCTEGRNQYNRDECAHSRVKEMCLSKAQLKWLELRHGSTYSYGFEDCKMRCECGTYCAKCGAGFTQDAHGKIWC